MTNTKYSLHHLGFLWKLLLVCDCGFAFRILPKTIMIANFQDLQFTLESQSLYLENLEPNDEVSKSFLWISLKYWFRMKCLLHPGNHFFFVFKPWKSLWNYPFVIFSLLRVLSTFRITNNLFEFALINFHKNFWHENIKTPFVINDES